MRSQAALLILFLLASCGGGGSDSSGSSAPASDPIPAPAPAPAPAPQAAAQYLSTVTVPTAGDLAQYSVDSSGSILTYSGATVPPVGAVVVVNGSAFKIAAQTNASPGATTLQTTTPDFQEVFEQLDISTTLQIGQQQPEMVQALDLTFPTTSISPNFGVFPAKLTGTLSGGTVTVDFHYSRSAGIARAMLVAKGTLALSADLRVEAGPSKTFDFPAATVIVPIPATLGTVAFKLPISVFGKVQSQLNAQVAHWDKSYSFAAGFDYTSQTGFQNLSSLTDISSTPTPVDKATLQAQINGFSLPTSNITVAAITIGPSIHPELSALNDTLGVVGLRDDVGLKASLNIKGAFPSLADCAEIPVSLTQTIYAFFNYKKYESILDFAGDVETAKLKVFGTETPIATYPLGTCGRPVLSIAPSAPALTVGDVLQLTVTAADPSGKAVPPPSKLNWSSSAPSVASVDQIGAVTARLAGTAVISVTDPDSGATSQVTATVNGSAAYYWYLVLQYVPCGASETASFTITGGGQTVSGSSSLTPAPCGGTNPTIGNLVDGPHNFTLARNTQYTVVFSYQGYGSRSYFTDLTFELDSPTVGNVIALHTFTATDPSNGQMTTTFTTPP